ncbi:hypothetical protein GE21DRAFT_1280377 [Neurospora crassa]|nr:hypothetical protein GE21DRAFT_1280377 [Neurospora crassa]
MQSNVPNSSFHLRCSCLAGCLCRCLPSTLPLIASRCPHSPINWCCKAVNGSPTPYYSNPTAANFSSYYDAIPKTTR